MVDTANAPRSAAESRWVEVCREEDVPPLEGRRVVISGVPIALLRTESGFHALHDTCPHLGGPLSDGDVAAGMVSCPLHARKIDLGTGRVTNDEGLSCAKTFSVRVREGRVYLDAAGMPEGDDV